MIWNDLPADIHSLSLFRKSKNLPTLGFLAPLVFLGGADPFYTSGQLNMDLWFSVYDVSKNLSLPQRLSIIKIQLQLEFPQLTS